jgi:hypothetical protein
MGALLCLLALTAQMCLPLLHSLQLIAEESPILIQPHFAYDFRVEEKAAHQALVSITKSGVPDSSHDSCHCPICQSILHSSSFALPHHGTVLLPIAVAGLLSDSSCEEPISRRFSKCPPRAPPHLA